MPKPWPRCTCAICSPATPTASRGSRCALDDLLLDYSKNRVTDETMGLLLDLARAGRARGLARRACSRASKINITEDRAVLHVALRNRSDRPIVSMAGTSCRTSARCWRRCATSAEQVRSGAWRGAHRRSASPTSSTSASAARTSGRCMVCEALKPYQRPDLRAAFRVQRRRRASRRHARSGSIRRARCSSSRPRPSPPRRP